MRKPTHREEPRCGSVFVLSVARQVWRTRRRTGSALFAEEE